MPATTGIIYMATHRPTGRIYVGATQDYQKRKASHHNSDSDLGAAIRKFGKEQFDWTILKDGLNVTELPVWERRFIRKLRARDPLMGFNKRRGGGSFRKVGVRVYAAVSNEAYDWLAARSKAERRTVSAFVGLLLEDEMLSDGQVHA